jgi:Glycosyl transferase family 2
MNIGKPRLSLIVEWDNARYYEVQRAKIMLGRVLDQLRELGQSAEIFLVFDALAIDQSTVQEVAASLTRQAPAGVDIEVIGTQGLRYYQLKNEGARRSRGDILLFVDTDVIPERGWLAALIGSFDDSAVQVVMANTYVEAHTLYGKTFAVVRYFPLRLPDGAVVPTASSLVNSIAFRREIFDRYPFPDDRELYIAQCIDLTATLRSRGIGVYMNPRARVSHPPPKFFRSAVINGHDVVIRERRARNWGPRASLGRLRRNLATAAHRLSTERGAVGLSRGGAGAAMTIATVYYLISFAAELLTRVNPRIVHRLYAL